MNKLVRVFFKLFKAINKCITKKLDHLYTLILFKLNGVLHSRIRVNGIPYVNISLSGVCIIGDNFSMNNSIRYCQSGNNGKCRIEVHKNAQLYLGKNVGISSTTITCFSKIHIDDHVNIGVGVHIYDTDFHSINSVFRSSKILDQENKVNKQIIIEKNVFIGAHSIILKGVIIGENSIVGAGSIVTKRIPPNEIWGGNPAKFIKSKDH